MKILVLNAGSSSLKFQLFDMEDESVMAKGIVERIGLQKPSMTYTAKEKTKFEKDEPISHKEALQWVLDTLTSTDHGVISSLDEIGAVGHRVVHGGEDFTGSVLIDDKVIESLERNKNLAPLHNPPNLTGIYATQTVLPNVPMVGVFDTAFHSTMPEKAYLYGLPIELYEKYKVRRYGFHGTSHHYVAQEAARRLGKDIKDLKIITAHLGNGASVCAIKGGQSIDTSMGFTPLEGLVMGTRSGDIDPAIVIWMMRELGMSYDEVDNVLNKKSGILGLVRGRSYDMRDIEDWMAAGDEEARRAMDVYCYRLKKYIGSYAAVLGGLDVLVFTAGVGENSPILREIVCDGLEFLGIKIDKEKNNVKGDAIISAADSKVTVMSIRTDEELMIARDTYRIVRGLK
ncbi:acetate/propionate family kinase [Coprothermobacter platensis]|uniref:acetate/propionate family kinase n=1 Tax=Coprothermobacter platensis TaxID=108819 RepID=UPI0003751EB6|nr:acetate kinase [Coprothermobacter platensis]